MKFRDYINEIDNNYTGKCPQCNSKKIDLLPDGIHCKCKKCGNKDELSKFNLTWKGKEK